MTAIALFEAKNRFSELIDRVQAGDGVSLGRLKSRDLIDEGRR